MQKNYFGIDFGTTNTSVVHLLVDEYGTKMVNCSEDEMPFPSLLAIHKKDGTMLFGRQVKIKRQQLSNDYYIVSSFKTKLGKDEEIIVAGKKYTPTDITALFLKSIKNYIEANMGLNIKEATFAIPIEFTSIQRKELKKAAEAAGIRVNKFISESTAAYMQNIELVKGLSKIAVFDWGGGTLDISILEIEKNILKELVVHGKKLGGDDIDKLLAKKVHADIASKNNNIDDYEDISDKDKDNIIAKCENAKIELSDDNFTRFQLIDYCVPGVFTFGLDLERFKGIIEKQIEDAVTALYEAVKKAQISIAQLDAIIMVGGSCEMQPIQEIMANLFEKKNIKIIYPEKMQWSVAAGAALIEKSYTKYRLNQFIGVILSDDSFYPVIEKDSAVPCEINNLRFGVVEETTDAHFIISDEHFNTLKIVNVPIKGFTVEGISLNAYIDEDMIANIILQSTHMGLQKKQKIEVHKLSFYYDLTNMDKLREFKKGRETNSKKKDHKMCSFMNCTAKATRGRYCDHHYSWERADSK